MLNVINLSFKAILDESIANYVYIILFLLYILWTESLLTFY